MHCFFTCPYAKQVWEFIPLHKAVHLAANTEFKDIIAKFRKALCLPPSGITLNILPWDLVGNLDSEEHVPVLGPLPKT